MNIRKAVAASSLILLAATPWAAQAGEGRATDSCIKAFVDNYVPAGHKVTVRKSGPVATPLTYFVRQYTIALSAQYASGQEIATARCVANPRGDVIVLDRPPVESYVAKADVKVELK